MRRGIISYLIESGEAEKVYSANPEFFEEIMRLYCDFADIIKEEVITNPEIFIVPGDERATKEGIKVFAENAFATFIDIVCELV